VKAQFIETVKACLANDDRLLEVAEELALAPSPTALALAILAEEKFAKGFLVFCLHMVRFVGTGSSDGRRGSIPASISYRS
jgi:hypothetical protein